MTSHKISQMPSFAMSTTDTPKPILTKPMSILATSPKSGSSPDSFNKFSLLEDNMGELEIVDTRKFSSRDPNSQGSTVIDDIPSKITGTYNENYNIIYVDEIIRKKLYQEKFSHLQGLRYRYKSLETIASKPQTYVMREKTLDEMRKIQEEIKQIETGAKLRTYNERVQATLQEYRKCSNKVKTVIFDFEDDEKYEEFDDDVRHRLSLIDKFLDIASDYIEIDVIRINNRPADICAGCGISLAKVATNDDDTQRCPNCQTEHNIINLAKMAKDGARINTTSTTEDESIDNFMRAFIRYQGLQPERPDDSLYDDLDAYFIRHDRSSGEEIRKLPLNSRGRRGDTDHKMLWTALSAIGRSEYYEDTNLIGHLYWGWTLPDVMHLKERIIAKYLKTQKVYYQIPPEERGRNSSLGTQYRLWRHLQLEGHECYMDEFKIAENPESIRTHHRLWRLMCEGANDPDIYFIP
jgi:hypothetical protein